jgi:hypothetical protein
MWLTTLFVATAVSNVFAPYLPDDVRQDALVALASIDFSEAALARAPHVAFASAESSTLSPEPILNGIHRFSQPRFDVWLMRRSYPSRQRAR